ncbi:alpha-L-rhamnosidase-related protein [Pleomorphovibrio marinus]|uniref:alpha-L-rhamnosidase-related protein n=1 Tax=Pleomorphovibrio marinus TaxID=2164132 RepID=UPI000E0A5A31|nr:family 78 glycoside hydrolase catalytic domain [Pleomorphovibrio marinus]
MKRRNHKAFVLGILFTFFGWSFAFSQAPQSEGTWIWYPGDYEIWLSNKMQARRTERGAFLPPLWRYYSPYPMVTFRKEVDIPSEDNILLVTDGQFKLQIDGELVHGKPDTIALSAGKHQLAIKVYNQETLPSLFLQGEHVQSDASWEVTYEDKEWIDETGQASDQSGTLWERVGYWNFDSPEKVPSEFALEVEPAPAVEREELSNGELIDFGKETFGYLVFHGLKGEGKIRVFYGESEEEAMDKEYCETLDELEVSYSEATTDTLAQSMAFRYVQVERQAEVSYDSVSMLYEFLPLDYKGSFSSSDDLLNEIWDVSAYTLHLNTREFFLDGIKRDRWIWSGDAYQSYLMNYYLFFDNPSVTRTLLALRGKDPISSHLNTIMDYSFYWFIGIYDYYLFTGDEEFIHQFYPRMVSLMDFCLERRNENGMMEGLPGDWVFIDWADGLKKEGEVSFQQLLLARSLEAMALSAGIVGDRDGEANYTAMAEQLREKLFDVFWSSEHQALMHHRVDGEVKEEVTRYANMFAIFFDYLSKDQQEAVKTHVLLNDEVQKITTPYMRFYELEALCALGEQELVLDEIREYWGGMLELGATSFWEKYDPKESGEEHLAMYGRPYGKSLCHAWGASPIYLFGKYYFGVSPSSPGYDTYMVEPNLGGLEWMEGSVPTPEGEITLFCSTSEIKIKADHGVGTLRIKSETPPKGSNMEFKKVEDSTYELVVKPGQTYELHYKAMQ